MVVFICVFFRGDIVHVSQLPPKSEEYVANCCCNDDNYQSRHQLKMSMCLKNIVPEVLCHSLQTKLTYLFQNEHV